MSSQTAAASYRWTAFEQLSFAREVMQTESRTIAQVARRLDEEFCRAADCLFNCRGSAIVTGIGKAGLIGQKIMATLASTGTRSHFLHPAEAVHGDLGRVHGDDVVLVLSQSGETEEIVRLLPPLAETRVPIIAITGRGRQHAWPARPRWSSTWDRWKRPVRWAWPPAAARRRCWPWAMPWRWWSAACGASPARILPAFIRPAILA